MVGKNVPYQTATSTSNNDTYNSYEYRDVGKTLKITPQINKDRMVRLNVSMEVSALESTTDFRPTTLKRTVETTVIVEDGSTVVIGGLIDDTFSQTEYRVPCLGDIPGLGWLFKSMAKGSDKTNLYFFITPKVIQNPKEAKTVFETKKSQIDELRETQIKLYKGGIGAIEPPSIDSNLPDAPVSGDTPDGPADGSDTNLPLSDPESTPSATDGPYLVQVHAYADQQSALEASTRLTQLGYAARVVATTIENQTWYRVQIDDNLDHAGAREIRDALIKQGYTGILLLRSNP
jgi:general secretion pathway protein D